MAFVFVAQIMMVDGDVYVVSPYAGLWALDCISAIVVVVA